MQKLGKVSGDSCDYGGIRYDTDPPPEAKNGFDFVISYFQGQEEASAEIDSLKVNEEVKVDMIMEGTKEGWKVLSEAKDLQQLCGAT